MAFLYYLERMTLFILISKVSVLPNTAEEEKRLFYSSQSKHSLQCWTTTLSYYVAPALSGRLQMTHSCSDSLRIEQTTPNCQSMTAELFLADNQVIKSARIAAIATSTFKYHGNATPLVDLHWTLLFQSQTLDYRETKLEDINVIFVLGFVAVCQDFCENNTDVCVLKMFIFLRSSIFQK